MTATNPISSECANHNASVAATCTVEFNQYQQEICWYVKGHYGRSNSKLNDLKAIVADGCLIDIEYISTYDVLSIVHKVFLICAKHNSEYYHDYVLKGLYRPVFPIKIPMAELHIELMCSMISTTQVIHMPSMGQKSNKFKF